MKNLGSDTQKALPAACNRSNEDLDVIDILSEAERSTGSTARLMSAGFLRAEATLESKTAYESDTESLLVLGEETVEKI